MPKAATGLLSTLVSKPYCAAPRLTVATSFRRTEAPFGSVRSRMFSNCSGVLKRPSALTVAVIAWPDTAGVRAECAGGELRVLRLHRRQHLRGGEVVGMQLVGIQPDAHRVLGTELHHRAHAGDALDLVEHPRGDDVVQLLGARPAGAGAQADAAEEAGADFGDADALLVHFRRQARRARA